MIWTLRRKRSWWDQSQNPPSSLASAPWVGPKSTTSLNLSSQQNWVLEPIGPWPHGCLNDYSNFVRPKLNSPWARFSECLLILAKASLPTNYFKMAVWKSSLIFPHPIQSSGSYLGNLLKISSLVSISRATTFCQDNCNNLNQGVVTMACCLVLSIKLYWLAQSYDHSLTYCLWLLSHSNGRVESLTCKAQHIYYRALCRKSWLTLPTYT